MAAKSTVQTARIKTRAQQAREEIDHLQKLVEWYETVPEDVYDNGAVLVLYKRFGEGSIQYTYVAVKAAGFWYVTGRSERYTWDAMTDFLWGNLSSSGSMQAFVVSEITELA